MRIISFSWTTPALLAGRKTMTRREWSPRHANGFHRGDQVQAWNKSPRNGGKKVGEIVLTADPEFTSLLDMEDYECEGFAFFDENPSELAPNAPDFHQVWEKWREGETAVWVVRFRLSGGGMAATLPGKSNSPLDN